MCSYLLQDNYTLLLRGGGRSEAEFLCTDFIDYSLPNFPFSNFILFYFLFIHITKRIFTLSRHGVPYIS